MGDTFQGVKSALKGYARAALIVPNDAADLSDVCQAVWVGGAGTLKVTMVSGDVVTLSGIVAGTLLQLRVKRVWATGTTATLLHALW
jgi:hypothetical protein